MDSDTRSAHRRVGAVAIAAFLALLLLGLTRGPASANQAAPAATPSATPQQQTPEFREGRGRRFRGGGGGVPDFGGGPPDGGGAPDPGTPDSGFSTT